MNQSLYMIEHLDMWAVKEFQGDDKPTLKVSSQSGRDVISKHNRQSQAVKIVQWWQTLRRSNEQKIKDLFECQEFTK